MTVHSYRSITCFGFTVTELLYPATSHRICPAEAPASDRHSGQFRWKCHIRACNHVQSTYIDVLQRDIRQDYFFFSTDSSAYTCPDHHLRQLFCIREAYLADPCLLLLEQVGPVELMDGSLVLSARF